LTYNGVYIIRVRYVSSYSPYYISTVVTYCPASGNATDQQTGFEFYSLTSAGNGTDSYMGFLGKSAGSGGVGGLYAKFPYGNVNAGGGTAYVDAYRIY